MERTRRALADAIRPFGPNGKLRKSDVRYVDALADALGIPPDQPAAGPSAASAPVEGELTPSPAAVAIIKEFEGLHDLRPDGLVEVYKCPANVWTIGYGATGPGILPGIVWTQEQCEERLGKDIAEFAAGIERLLADAPTAQNQFDALVSFAFNIGLAAFERSTVLKQHKAGNHSAAANAFGLWNKGGGRILGGLVRRRAAEARLYSTA